LASGLGKRAVVTPNGPSVDTAVRVWSRLGVTDTVPWPVAPTATEPNSKGFVVSTAVVGRPKPMMWPSRVPTKTRPASVAGTTNLAAVRT